jgi:hypothetical protein
MSQLKPSHSMLKTLLWYCRAAKSIETIAPPVTALILRASLTGVKGGQTDVFQRLRTTKMVTLGITIA